MSQERDQRLKSLRQYMIFRIKIIEFMHLFGILIEFTSRRVAPENNLEHDWKHFEETLLHTTINHFITFTDPHKDGLDVRRVWSILFPKHRRAIDRYWNCGIEDGWKLIRSYRDNVGCHSGNLEKFLTARGTLMNNRKRVLGAIRAFLGLSISLMRREVKELADFSDFIESTLLDFELQTNRSLNRRWLRDWKLLEAGNYSKKFT